LSRLLALVEVDGPEPVALALEEAVVEVDALGSPGLGRRRLGLLGRGRLSGRCTL
jgi:hypothetical protein